MSPDRWADEIHAYLIQALKRCYALAYENRERVMQAEMTPSMIQYVNTVVRSFGTGVYQEPGGATATAAGGHAKGTYADVASEAITRRAQSLQVSSPIMPFGVLGLNLVIVAVFPLSYQVRITKWSGILSGPAIFQKAPCARIRSLSGMRHRAQAQASRTLTCHNFLQFSH